jgi:predicted aconitase
MTLRLDDDQAALLDGSRGQGAQEAMRLMVHLAEALGAPKLVPITRAHINGCAFNGQAGLDFAERMVALGAEVRVPTTLNTGLVSESKLGPTISPELGTKSLRLMELYKQMGCQPTWTCAPYWLGTRPGFGDQIAWAETNANTFANSVLGARSERYGDYTDISAAITGYVPYRGLHRPENRRGQVVYDVSALNPRLFKHQIVYGLLGYFVGNDVRDKIPVLVGLPPEVTEQQLREFASISALSGTVKLFHVVGVTPEAGSLDEALQGQGPEREVRVTSQDLLNARKRLVGEGDQELTAVCFGTPHYSFEEIERLVALFDGRRVADGVQCYLSTGRFTYGRATEAGFAARLDESGIEVVLDTCTYFQGYTDELPGRVLTDSAKWSYYAPASLRAATTYATVEECVESAVTGVVNVDTSFWEPEWWAEVV